MKKIKFRGKDIDTNKWVFGYVGEYGYNMDNLHFMISCWEKNIEFPDGTLNFFEVIPETISQFTGEQDDNGNDIYELLEHK